MSRRDIAIIPHTEKSFVVISTNHIAHMISLKNLGGVFDASLLDKETGKKIMGWIFFMNKKDEILNWINDGCPKVYSKPESKVDQEEINETEDFKNRIESSLETILLRLDCFEVQIRKISEELNIIKSRLDEEEKSSDKNETEEEYEILN